MSERRVGQVIIQTEYDVTTNYRDVGGIQVHVEYQVTTTYRKVGQILLMVEYRKAWPGDTPAGRVQGPAAQIF